MTIADFANAIVAYRRATKGSVTSWGRSVAHNKAVGGVERSFHLEDLAVDMVYDTPTPHHEEARKIGASLGLRILREGDHDHIDPLSGRGA